MHHPPTAHPALTTAITAALPPIPTLTAAAQPGATPRNTAQQSRRPAQNEPTPHHGQRTTGKGPPRLLKPIQLTAARLLLAGHPTSAVAAALRVHPYTISRWKRDPRFRRELDRQLAIHLTLDHDDPPPTPAAQRGATPRNTAQQSHPAGAKRTHPRDGQRTTDGGQRTHDHGQRTPDNAPSGFPATSDAASA